MVRIFLSGFIGLASWALPGPGQGQNIPSPYRFVETRHEVGLRVSYLSLGTGAFDYGPRPGVGVGAHYGFRVTGPFALETNFLFLPTRRSLIDPGRDEGDRKVGESDARLLGWDARLRFNLTGDRTWRALQPSVQVGAGLALDLAGGSPTEQEKILPEDRFRFGVPVLGTFGGGLAWLPFDPFLFRMDLGVTLWALRAPKGYRNPTRGLGQVDRREWVGGPTISVGAAYRF